MSKLVPAWNAEGIALDFAHAMRNMRPKYTGPTAAQREANELAEHVMKPFADRPAKVQALMLTSGAARMLRASFDMRDIAPAYAEHLLLASRILSTMSKVKRHGLTGSVATASTGVQ